MLLLLLPMVVACHNSSAEEAGVATITRGEEDLVAASRAGAAAAQIEQPTHLQAANAVEDDGAARG